GGAGRDDAGEGRAVQRDPPAGAGRRGGPAVLAPALMRPGRQPGETASARGRRRKPATQGRQAAMTTRRERLEAKLEKRQEWAASRDAKATQHLERSDAIAERFELGQPILVGHHSEGRARRDQQRMW